MIVINKNTTNRLALTLNELSSIYNSGGNPYFLFEFENSQTKLKTYFNPILISASTRSNVFEIIESSTPNFTGGTVNLTEGYYEYKIYEQSSQYNLSLSGVTTLVEYGKAYVLFEPAANYAYTANTTTNNVYYN